MTYPRVARGLLSPFVVVGAGACTDLGAPADQEVRGGYDAADVGTVDAARAQATPGSDAAPTLDANAVNAAPGDAGPALESQPPVPPTVPGVDASVADASAEPRLAPLETDGEPLEGAEGEWTYVEFPGAVCRDGTPTGIFLSRQRASKKLMIFLEGGGVCSDPQTCELTAPNISDSVSVLQTLLAATGSGVFDRENQENPVRDWNFVYVPYCTGDRHAGNNPNGDVPGVGPQKFVGHHNMQLFLNRIAPTFRDATDLLVAGTSAGGAGADRTSVLVQRAFPQIKVKTINDSHPPLAKDVLATCQQEQWRTLFNLDQTNLAECGAACPNHSDYWQDYAVFLAKTFRDRPSGLISPMEDWVERTLFGIGNDNCTGTLDFLNPGISPEAYRAALLAHREKLRQFPNFGTFYIDGPIAASGHGTLVFEDFYVVTAGGVRLVDWFRKIVEGQSPGHAGP